MNLVPLCEMQMHYTWIDFVDYGAGGQYVGTLEGTVTGDRLRRYRCRTIARRQSHSPAGRPDSLEPGVAA